MKTPEEIKELLANHKGYIYDGEALMADALKYIQQLEAQAPKWISVEERLPEEGQKVMVCGLRNGMQVGAFRGLSRSGRNRKWWWKKNTILEVTHWMPLPEPPKEG